MNVEYSKSYASHPLFYRKDIEGFINKDNAMRLIIYAENGRDYVAAMHPPVKYKKKAMFFLKREPCVLTNDNLHDQVIYGDSTEAPLESLSSITKHVFMPLLSCPDNQDGWPDFLTKEVSESLHKFTASVFVAIGQMQGKTTLPLPAGAGLLLVQKSIFQLCSQKICQHTYGNMTHPLYAYATQFQFLSSSDS